MKEFYFVTSNKNKIKEAEEILGIKLKHIDLDIQEIQSIDVEDIVKDKAVKAFNVIKKPVLVEDTGLFIKDWRGFPGALIKWVLKTMGIKEFSRLALNKKAVAACAACVSDGKKFIIAVGKVEGKIVRPRGISGFGWDSIFQPKGYNKTFAQLDKQKISHRRKALIKLRKNLE
jgi:non-canonical purine NTP pyrophosphatase (RdgB/HAM1 family)